MSGWRKLLPVVAWGCAAVAVAAVAGPGARSAHAVLVQFPFEKNADVIRETGGAAPQGLDNSGRAFVTQSQATLNDTIDPRGLPDNGVFPAGPIPEDNLRFDPYTGNNAWRFDDPGDGPFNVYVPLDFAEYRSVHLYATAGNGPAPLRVWFHCICGAPPVWVDVTVPDWLDDPPPGGSGYLIDGLDRTGAGGLGFEDVDDPAIFAVRISDPTLGLSHFNVQPGPGFNADDVVTVFAAAGDRAPEPGAAGVFLAAAATLLARRRRPAAVRHAERR